MKTLIRIIAVAAILFVSCGKEYDDTELIGQVNQLENRVAQLESLCKQMNTNITSLQSIVKALQENDYVTGVTPVSENGVEVGYTISFAKAESITIYHGKDGEKGKDGAHGKDGKLSMPTIGVKMDADGIYYWTLDGKWMTDASGNKIKAEGRDGKNGDDGKDAVTPLLKIENDYWFVSYDNGSNWQKLGKATGKNGASFFQEVSQDDSNLYLKLADGTLITLPKELPLSMSFNSSDLGAVTADSSRSIRYTVSSAAATVLVEVTSSADIKSKVVSSDASGKTGTIQILTGSSIDEYSNVLVFVSDGTKVLMYSIRFGSTGLIVE